MKSINFSIIIPNLNGSQLLPACLKSLLVSIAKIRQSKFEIILVDNASTDNSISLAQKIYPKIKIIKNKNNRGFATAVNQGINQTQHSYVVVCNNDITVKPNYFSLMQKNIKTHPQITAFVGTILNKTGDRIESTGLRFNYSGKCTHLKRPYRNQKPQLIWGAAAALVVYHKQTLKKLDLFDSHFFAYEEDVDLALRLHNSGYKTLWIPQAISYHIGGATSSRMGNFRNRHDAKNWIYIIIKNYSLKQITHNLPGIIDQRLRNFSGLLKNTPFLLWLPTVIHTYGQVIIKLPVMLVKRKQIKNQKKYLNINIK